MSARRYCGTLALTIRYVARDDSYTVRIREVNADLAPRTLTDLHPSPHDRARFAVDSSALLDRIADAALGFASYEDEMITAYAEIDPEATAYDVYKIRRKL